MGKLCVMIKQFVTFFASQNLCILRLRKPNKNTCKTENKFIDTEQTKLRWKRFWERVWQNFPSDNKILLKLCKPPDGVRPHPTERKAGHAFTRNIFCFTRAKTEKSLVQIYVLSCSDYWISSVKTTFSHHSFYPIWSSKFVF